ncbi:Mu transposase C-terminal domain-containing protein [Streptomyces sp. H10-C2]|uniref:Mu transposase C-terminal domain-containing protein n=1 Tax=unclassified Streptomyces TaxID=2593676 RepID=UPI0024BBBEF2|nr:MULTISPECIES: Mu transposase C-terminal domain-containing protein [unclassified Streptomyces]MDJ0346686.1 Mu transposase C-terminal domain-containing protein [Streptomyces sp. PH10-H1]MDJ0373910.1 Mu transposase C-terminal domain-containing protein [Streptomyces sp. H10-C2]
MPLRPRLLRAGDLVRFDGRLHTVAALEGTAVRLVDESQSASVVMLAHLLTFDGFEVVTPASVRAVVPAAGVLEGLPCKAVDRAEWWQRHLVEMLTGRTVDDPHGPVRGEYDPAVRSLRQRELAKADELAAAGHPASLALIQRMRGRFERGGVLGLVDPRLRAASDGTGRADPRVIAALRKVVDEQTGRSTVSAQVLRRRMERVLDAEHGPGVVPVPSRTSFYRLLAAVTSGRHTLGSARTRRSLAKQPDGMFGQLTAARPGEVMEIDSTPLDVLVVHDDGTVDTVELTGIVDIATRTLAAAVLRPSTKAVDAALLLARAMTPEPMRPGWADALRMSRSVLPHTSLLALDERLAKAAAVPVITPETIVCDRGKAYISDTFRSACQALGISFQPCHPDTPTDKPHIEKTLGSVATMFTQYLPGHKGRSTEHRGADPAGEAVWSVHQLQELLQEWIVIWQNRPHDGLRDPLMPGKAMSPNEKYAALVAAAGHVPIALTAEEYIELLPRHRRTINSYGVRINHRTYDSAELDPFRRQPSRAGPDGRGWEVHYDPYDISRVWVRNHRQGGWITAIWRHLRTAPMPMGELAWDHARRILAERGADSVTEEEIAQAAVALLDRATDGPEPAKAPKPSRRGRRDRKVAARTRATSAPTWPRPAPEPDPEPQPAATAGGEEELAKVVPLEIFDARKEAEKWW